MKGLFSSFLTWKKGREGSQHVRACRVASFLMPMVGYSTILDVVGHRLVMESTMQFALFLAQARYLDQYVTTHHVRE